MFMDSLLDFLMSSRGLCAFLTQSREKQIVAFTVGNGICAKPQNIRKVFNGLCTQGRRGLISGFRMIC